MPKGDPTPLIFPGGFSRPVARERRGSVVSLFPARPAPVSLVRAAELRQADAWPARPLPVDAPSPITWQAAGWRSLVRRASAPAPRLLVAAPVPAVRS